MGSKLGLLDKYAAKENSYEWHFPGQEFTGPGTHIISKILKHVLPVNKTDFLTMLHDIQYLQYAGIDDVNFADDLAIKQVDYDLPGLATKLGLTIRKLLNLPFNTTKFPIPDTRIMGSLLMNIAKKQYADLFQKYNVDINLY